MNSNQHTPSITVIPVRPEFTPTHPTSVGDESTSNLGLRPAQTTGRRTFGRFSPRRTFGRYTPRQTFGRWTPRQTFGRWSPRQTFGRGTPRQTFGRRMPRQTFSRFTG
jgi:hypothetical protein